MPEFSPHGFIHYEYFLITTEETLNNYSKLRMTQVNHLRDGATARLYRASPDAARSLRGQILVLQFPGFCSSGSIIPQQWEQTDCEMPAQWILPLFDPSVRGIAAHCNHRPSRQADHQLLAVVSMSRPNTSNFMDFMFLALPHNSSFRRPLAS